MSFLKKEIKVGDELQFDCKNIDEKGSKQIFLKAVEAIGEKIDLRIRADRSIPIIHFKNNKTKNSQDG